MDGKKEKITTSNKSSTTTFIVVASFIILIVIYLFNATNGINDDIPTDLITGIIGTIVGYYFLRGKNNG